jgi:DNA polymerase III sliding clamp (beta) subunit (PCNA family)
MKLKTKAGEFFEALTQAAITIGKREDLPSSWLYMYTLGEKDKGNQRLLMFSTDMIAKTLVSLPVEVETLGSVTIRPRLLTDFLYNLPEEEEVELSASNSGNLDFKSSLGKGMVLGGAGDPGIKSLVDTMPFKEKPLFEMEADKLTEMIARTEFCTTASRTIAMSGVNLKTVQDGYVAEATDGNILAVAYSKDEKSPGPGHQALIPGYGLAFLKSLLSRAKEELVQVVFDKGEDGKPTKVFFKFARVFFGVSLLTEPFPNPNLALEQAHKIAGSSFKIDYNILRQALQRAIPFADDGKIKIVLKGNTLSLSTGGRTTGSFSASVNGADPAQKLAHTMYLNARYLTPIMLKNSGNVLTITTTTDSTRVLLLDNDNAEQTATYLLACVQS